MGLGHPGLKEKWIENDFVLDKKIIDKDLFNHCHSILIIRLYFIISFNSYQTFDVINTLKE